MRKWKEIANELYATESSTTLLSSTENVNKPMQSAHKHSLQPKRHCFVSMLFGGEENLSPEIWGVRVLAESLIASESFTPLYIIVPQKDLELATKILKPHLNVIVIGMTPWGPTPRLHLELNKLQVFSLIPGQDCQKFVFIDANAYFLRNPDYLFGFEHLSAAISTCG